MGDRSRFATGCTSEPRPPMGVSGLERSSCGWGWGPSLFTMLPHTGLGSTALCSLPAKTFGLGCPRGGHSSSNKPGRGRRTWTSCHRAKAVSPGPWGALAPFSEEPRAGAFPNIGPFGAGERKPPLSALHVPGTVLSVLHTWVYLICSPHQRSQEASARQGHDSRDRWAGGAWGRGWGLFSAPCQWV